MNRAPTRAEIAAAEQKCVNAGVATVDGLHRAQARFREKLARTSSLVMVAGAAGLFVWWRSRRRAVAKATTAAEQYPVAHVSSTFGLVLAFLTRYGAEIFQFLQQQKVAYARQRRTTLAHSTIADSLQQADSNGQPT